PPLPLAADRRADPRIGGRQLVLAFDVARGIDRERALRLQMLVLAGLGRHDREVRPVVAALGADQVLLAGLPAPERDPDRARERDRQRAGIDHALRDEELADRATHGPRLSRASTGNLVPTTATAFAGRCFSLAIGAGIDILRARLGNLG